MTTQFSRRVAMTAFVFSLALSPSTHAQTSAPAASPPPGIGQPQTEDRNQENLDRQALREEIEQVRKEHDDVESARDKLWDECAKTRDKPIDACQQEKKALDDRRDKLHVRAVALHEKLEGLRKDMREEHRQEHSDAGGMRQPPTPASAPAK